MTTTAHYPPEEFDLRRTLLEPRSFEAVTRQAGGRAGPVHLPATLHAPGQELLCDFGEETVGYFSCELVCGSDVVVNVLYGESRTEALSDDSFDVGWYHRAADVIRAPAGSTVFRATYRRGFRYARLKVMEGAGAVVVKSVRAEQVHYPFAREGRFACSDPLLNRIWAISRRTMLLTSQQWYEDGIKRDGMLWVGDYRVSYLCNATLFGDTALARKCLAAFANAQMPGGAIPATGNNGGLGPAWERNIEYMADCGSADSWHSRWLVANYAYDWVLSLLEYYEHTADAGLIRTLWPQARRAIDWVIRDGSGELVMDIQDGKWFGSQAWISIWRYWAVMAGQALALLVSDSGTALQCAQYLDGKAADLRARYLDSDRGYFADGKDSGCLRHASAAALLAGIVSPEEAACMFARLGREKELRPELAGMAKFYVHYALMKAGLVPEALSDIRASYGYMLEHDATTCWEHCRQVEPEPLISRCHGWSSGPVYLFPTYLLGVRPAAPGFARVRVAPDLGGLQWAEGAIPLPQGDLTVRWEAGPAIRGLIVLPEGVTGELILRSAPGPVPRVLHSGENIVG